MQPPARWRSYGVTAPIPAEAITPAMREKMHGGGEAHVMLLEWIVDSVPVLVGRAGGTLGGAAGETITDLSPNALETSLKLTEVGNATAMALLTLAVPMHKRLLLVEIETKTKPDITYMVERLDRIWRNLQPEPWDRILMVGDMAKMLDGVMLKAMNVVGVKTIDELAAEMGA